MQIDQQPNKLSALKMLFKVFSVLLFALKRACVGIGFLVLLISDVTLVNAATTQLHFQSGEIELPQTPLVNDIGEKVHLADFKGRPLIVNFWASWCAPCITELPELESLAKHYTETEPVIILVNLDRGGVDVAQPFLDKTGVVSPISLFDSQADWAKQLKIRGLPLTLFIASDQSRYSFHVGPAKWTDPLLKSQLREQLAF